MIWSSDLKSRNDFYPVSEIMARGHCGKDDFSIFHHPHSRTLLVEIDVDNPTGTLLTGSYAEVHLSIPTPSG